MFQNTFNYLNMNDIDMINTNYGFYDYNDYDYMSDTTSIDDYDLDPDYIPYSDDSSNDE